MSEAAAGLPTTLSDLFRGYYRRVVQCRRRFDESGELAIAEAQEPLLEVLATLEAGEEDRYATDSVSLQHARYLMAAFADDLLGRDGTARGAEWRGAALESRLFQSDEGGEELFRRIDRLLEVGDPGRRELAALYLLALALGFRGRLAGESAEGALRTYRQRLLALAAPERQAAEAAAWISPTAYRHTLSRGVGGGTGLLPNLKLWGWIAGGALLVLLLVSSWVFSEHTAGIAASVERILETGASE